MCVCVCVFVYDVRVRSMNIADVISRTELEMLYQIEISKIEPSNVYLYYTYNLCLISLYLFFGVICEIYLSYEI